MSDYAISTWTAESAGAEEAIELLAAAGFELAELSGGVSPLMEAWRRDPCGVVDALKNAGLELESAHSPRPGRLLDAADPETRRASLQANAEFCRHMAASGVELLVVHPTGAGPDPGESFDAWRGRAIDSLAELADEADRWGVRLAVENIGRDAPGSRMDDLIDMIAGLGDHVGLCHDVGHSVQAGFDPRAELRAALASGKLFSLHLHDVKPDNVDHFLPGEGVVDLDGLIDDLNAAEFAGLRVLEIKPPAEDLPGRLRAARSVLAAWTRRGASREERAP